MHNEYPKISIITPVYNLGQYLEQAILSVINQNYPNLEYIIVDGGSTDNTIEIVKKYEKYLAYWVSEPDNGLYHALQKGFERSTGEIMAWLNADDMYHPGSLKRMAKVFELFPKVEWVTGFPTTFDENGILVNVHQNAFKKWSKYNVYMGNFQWIQQESTFWRRTLWNTAGGKISDEYQFAGDFELWLRFFRHAQLFSVPILIGGYRVRKEQLSRIKVEEYEQEIRRMISKEPLTSAVQGRIRKIKIIRYLLKMNLFLNLKQASLYYYGLFEYPLTITFNRNTQKLEIKKEIDITDFKLKMCL